MKTKLIIFCAFIILMFGAWSEIIVVKFGENTLTGTIILKNLTHPVTGKVIKNSLVFKLYKKVKFIEGGETGEVESITDEVRVYGDVTSEIDPNKKYKALINKKVKITANFVYAPSGNYPLDVNIIEDFKYEILN